MLLKSFFFILLFFLSFFGFSQTSEINKALKILALKGEISFRFEVLSIEEINTLTKIISIDEQTKPKSRIIYAYANKLQFEKFLELNYPFEIVNNLENIKNGVTMCSSFLEKGKSWDAYPTYQAYIDQMDSYKSAYPSVCQIFEIGKSVLGRKILFARLTNPNSSNQRKPRVMLTSSMHGDETAGYVFLLRAIDYLLTNYGISTKETSLLDDFEIWINPIANPDGTYAGGDNTVAGATRYNAHNIDLNRNFPDFVAGPHPDNVLEWQPENVAMMHLADSLNFAVSINIHGGEEVVNYPWDTKLARHADEAWWQYIAKNYADTVFSHAPAGYFTSVSNTGYTNGSDWYIITGGRQDYMNYYHHCREFTLEISINKTPIGSMLPTIWEANYRSIFNFIKESNYGVGGIVTDSVTGVPIEATINIPGHDEDNSYVISEPVSGNYFRPIYQGQYTMQVTASGYRPKNTDISTINGSAVSKNVQLVHYSAGIENIDATNLFTVYPNPTTEKLFVQINTMLPIFAECELFSMLGEKIFTEKKTFSNGEKIIIDISNIKPGLYYLSLNYGEHCDVRNFMITK